MTPAPIYLLDLGATYRRDQKERGRGGKRRKKERRKMMINALRKKD